MIPYQTMDNNSVAARQKRQAAEDRRLQLEIGLNEEESKQRDASKKIDELIGTQEEQFTRPLQGSVINQNKTKKRKVIRLFIRGVSKQVFYLVLWVFYLFDSLDLKLGVAITITKDQTDNLCEILVVSQMQLIVKDRIT